MESYALLCKHVIMLMADAFIINQTCEVNIWEPLIVKESVQIKAHKVTSYQLFASTYISTVLILVLDTRILQLVNEYEVLCINKILLLK